jgi:hypothetical protein
MPIPLELVDGIKRVVFPLCDSITVLSGWFVALHPSLLVPVEYSCKALLREACKYSKSSLVILLSNVFTSASERMVRGILAG